MEAHRCGARRRCGGRRRLMELAVARSSPVRQRRRQLVGRAASHESPLLVCMLEHPSWRLASSVELPRRTDGAVRVGEGSRPSRGRWADTGALPEAGPHGRPRVRDYGSRHGRLGAGGLRLQGRSGAWWRQAGYLRRSRPSKQAIGQDGHPDPVVPIYIRAAVTLGNKIVLSSINREKCGTHIGVNCREMSDGWRRVIMLVSRLQLQTCKLHHGSKYICR
jgi:hypothetical protein